MTPDPTRSRRWLLRAAVLVLGLGLVGCERHVLDEDDCRVEFPARAAKTVNALETETGGTTVTRYETRSGGAQYVVSWVDIPAEGRDLVTDRRRLASVRDSILERSQVEALEERDLDLDGFPLLEVEGRRREDPSWRLVARLVATERRLVQAIVLFPEGASEEPRRFLDSFHVAGEPTTWEEQLFHEHGFLAVSPNPLELGTSEVETPDGDVEISTFSTLYKGISLAVSVNQLPENAPAMDPVARLEGARDGTRKNLDALLVTDREVTVGGQPARQFVLETKDDAGGKLRYVGRVFLRGERLYQVVGVNPAGEDPTGIVERFLATVKPL